MKTIEEIEEIFDNGESIDEYLDHSTARMVNLSKLGEATLEIRLPNALVDRLNNEAKRLGIDRSKLVEKAIEDALNTKAPDRKLAA